MTPDPAAAAALAAAVAAAAEIAKNSPLYYSGAPTPGKHIESIISECNDNTKPFLAAHEEEDAEKRLARSRERNREHARRTRLRKKAQLEALQAKVTQLEDEGRVLKQSIEECSIASILVGLSSGNQHSATDSLLDVTEVKASVPKVMRVGKRKRFVCDDSAEQVAQPLKLNIDGEMTLLGGGKTHINWKSGVYCDENGLQRQLTSEQLESLRYEVMNLAFYAIMLACFLYRVLTPSFSTISYFRRERNRMHAKMTRDRKKNFISSVQKTIQHLEGENKRMRDVLANVAEIVGSECVTPVASPVQKPIPEPSMTPEIQDECVTDCLASKLHQHITNSFKLTTA